MNRELKFRVWDNTGKEFLNDGEWSLDNCNHINIFSNTNEYIGQYYCGDENSRYRVQQYTGSQDKNGVEIYEGDYVLHPHKSGGGFGHIKEKINWQKCEVKWKNGGLAGYWGHDDCNIVTFNNEQFVVVGNIFENKELM